MVNAVKRYFYVEMPLNSCFKGDANRPPASLHFFLVARARGGLALRHNCVRSNDPHKQWKLN